jgi:hypothetical protein
MNVSHCRVVLAGTSRSPSTTSTPPYDSAATFARLEPVGIAERLFRLATAGAGALYRVMMCCEVATGRSPRRGLVYAVGTAVI